MKKAQALLVVLVMTLIAFVLQPGCTSAQTEDTAAILCLPKETMVDYLSSKFGEAPIALGIGPKGDTLMEIFVSKSGSWSIVGTLADEDVSCVLFSGEDFYYFGQGALGRQI
jgi:hypothetical protein